MLREQILPSKKAVENWTSALREGNISTVRALTDTSRYEELAGVFVTLTDSNRQIGVVQYAGDRIVDVILRHAFTSTLVTAGNVGLEIPVRIHLEYDDKGRVEFWCADGIKVSCLPSESATPQPQPTRLQVSDEWRESLFRASKVAFALWWARHGAYGRHLIQATERASIIVDLSIAEALLPPGKGTILLDGMSATAAFSLGILARMVGREFVGPSLVTGEVNEALFRVADWNKPPVVKNAALWLASAPISDKRPFDFSLTWTDPAAASPAVRGKIDAAERSGSHQVVVVPEVTDGLRKDEEWNTQLRLVHTAYLGTAVDASFFFPWRQSTYFRAPELLWEFHRGRDDVHGIRSVRTTGRAFLRKQLSEDTQVPILLLQGELGAGKSYALVGALVDLRRDIGEAARQGRSVAPFPTWTYFRCVPIEQEFMFWRSLFQALGATTENWATFVDLTKTWLQRARVFAELMNAQATESAPRRRGPDVLILDNFDVSLHAAYDERHAKMLSSRPFLVKEIIRHAAPLLARGSPHIPRVRLVLEMADKMLGERFVDEVGRGSTKLISLSADPSGRAAERRRAEELVERIAAQGDARELVEVIGILSLAPEGIVLSAALFVLEEMVLRDPRDDKLTDRWLLIGECVLHQRLPRAQSWDSSRALRQGVRSLAESGILRHSHGVFHVWPPLRDLVLERIASAEAEDSKLRFAIAAAHARIAQTLMPTSWGQEHASISLLEELEPESLALALDHLEEADRRFGPLRQGELLAQIRSKKLFQILLMMPASLHRAIASMGIYKRETPPREELDDALGALRAVPQAQRHLLHPMVFRRIGHAVERARHEKPPDETPEKYYRLALGQAEAWLDTHEHEHDMTDLQYVFQEARSTLANHLLEKDLDSVEGLAFYEVIVSDAEKQGWPLPAGCAELYERMGDREIDDSSATIHYSRGARAVPTWAPNIVKWAGCLAQEDVQNTLMSIDQGDVTRAIARDEIRNSMDRRISVGRERIQRFRANLLLEEPERDSYSQH
jgi:hypothetical protein